MSDVKLQFLGSGDAFGTGGKFNTCFYVTAPSVNFLIDCGASSLVAMRKFDVQPNDVDMIFLTHLHGDHFGGVIFFLMDATFISERQKPLTIVGPPTVKERVIQALEAFYPDCWEKVEPLDIRFVEFEPLFGMQVGDVFVTPHPAKHLNGGNDFILRFEVDGKVITYTGDTGWTDALIPATRDADLFITECFLYDEPCAFHMDYYTLMEKLPEITAKQIYVTHFGPDMIDKADRVSLGVAEDGKIVEV